MPMLSRAFLLFLLLPASTFAHDFWIEPSSWRFSPTAAMNVSLRVGEHFAGDELPRRDRMVQRFALITAGGETKIVGSDGRVPAGTIAARSDETAVIVYRGARSAVTLPSGKFESYLREEGLERVIEERRKRGESNRPGREAFSRAAKAIVGSPDRAASSLVTRSHRLALELVPAGDPRRRSRDGNTFQLLYEGKPVEGALVVAISRKDPAAKVSARTDRMGRAALSIDSPGEWLIKSVHMVRIDEPAADWESVWASLTFLRE